MTEVYVPKLLTIKEVVRKTGIEKWRFYEMFARGDGPPHMRVGKTIRVPEDALAQWIKDQTAKGQQR